MVKRLFSLVLSILITVSLFVKVEGTGFFMHGSGIASTTNTVAVSYSQSNSPLNINFRPDEFPENLLLDSSKPNIFQKVKQFFVDLFSVKNNKEATNNIVTNERTVYLGGNAIGFSIAGNGVVIVGISEVDSPSGRIMPSKMSNLRQGDILLKIEGIEIDSGEKIGEVINSEEFAGKSVSVELLREGKSILTSINPALDNLTGKYKLGLWIRDNASGVGTLTFVEKNGDFASLGHPVSDIDTGVIIPVKSGSIYKSTIIGVKKGQRGVPGEIKGMFVKGKNAIGSITSNNENGVYGKIDENYVQNYSKREIQVANRSEIKLGKASIFTCIDSSNVEEFEVEIVRTNNQNSKNLVIRVTDKRLLDITGGIVQGMSGSPIVQGNKLIGCITHVFVNDPTKGFGMFVDMMKP